MKRLKFKKPFNGMDNAKKLIPESYKIDGNEFEITDGNETYRVKWESGINEGTILSSSNKVQINEDMKKMKHLMGFKSQETLGTLKGSQRIDENNKFSDVFNKSKKLINEMTVGYGFSNEGNLEGHETNEEFHDESLKEMDGGMESGVSSIADIAKELKSKGASISKANFTTKERMIVGKLLDIVDKLSQESNGFSSQVLTKLEGLTSAIDTAITKSPTQGDATTSSIGGDSSNMGFNESEECNECGDMYEMDRFDEIFEDMNEEGEDFPDLTGDGKVTQADILKGRGVFEDEE
jgi:hypothetical protein